MGTACSSCTSSPEEAAVIAKDQALAKQARVDADRDHRKIKLLLLGAGESGKSTILKQIRILYGTGFSDAERAGMRAVVCSNTIAAMKALLCVCVELGIRVCVEEAGEAGEAPGAGNADAAARVARTPDDTVIAGELARDLAALWRDPGVRRAYAERSRFQIPDSAAYFLDRVEAIAEPGYIPTVEDVLKTRVRTSGIIEEEYVIDGVTFVVFDVGGQRNERRKWIHCFDDVTAILFVVAISEYDQTLFEDNQVNRLVEALNLFSSICNNRHFENTSIILFLNKRDLFSEKIKTVPLRQRNPDVLKADEQPWLFDDYTGGQNEEAAMHYILDQFLQKNTNKKKTIFWQLTCATDTDNISTVFQSTKEIILKNNLISSGFMD